MTALRCTWSGRPDPGTREIELPGPHPLARPEHAAVCPEHEARLRAFHAYAARHRNHFFLAFAAVLVLAAASVMIGPDLGIALVLLLLGTALIAFPFATPLTVERMGVARSALLLRAMGVALLAFGAAFLWLGLA